MKTHETRLILILLALLLIFGVSGGVARMIDRLCPPKPVLAYPSAGIVFTDMMDDDTHQHSLGHMPNGGTLTFFSGRHWEYTWEFAGQTSLGDVYVFTFKTPEGASVMMTAVFAGSPIVLLESEQDRVEIRRLANKAAGG